MTIFQCVSHNNILPIFSYKCKALSVKYIPEWVPGAGFKKIAREYRKILIESAERPYAFARMQLASGNARPSLVTTFLESEPSPDEERIMKRTALAVYGAGADTVSKISSLLLR